MKFIRNYFHFINPCQLLPIMSQHLDGYQWLVVSLAFVLSLALYVFHIFFSGISSGIEGTLSKFADDAKLCGAVYTPEDNMPSRDLDSFEQWVQEILTKSRIKVFYLHWGKPHNHYKQSILSGAGFQHRYKKMQAIHSKHRIWLYALKTVLLLYFIKENFITKHGLYLVDIFVAWKLWGRNCYHTLLPYNII